MNKDITAQLWLQDFINTYLEVEALLRSKIHEITKHNTDLEDLKINALRDMFEAK